MSVTILTGDALTVLKTLPDESVQTCVTSPPYWALRAYGTDPVVWGGDPEHGHDWEMSSRTVDINNGNGSAVAQVAFNKETRYHRQAPCACRCGAWLGELGQEPTPDLFVEHMVLVFREVRRVLKQDGTLWLNIGDSYAGSGKGPTGYNGIGDQEQRQGFVNDRRSGRGIRGGQGYELRDPVAAPGCKPKDLVGIPWMLAFALRADGWWLRSNIRWCKAAPMPESVQDRPTSAVEDIFLLAKSKRYFYSREGAREPAVSAHPSGNGYGRPEQISRGGRGQADGWQPVPDRNMRNFWLLNPEPFAGAHFATFPPEIPRRCIMAGSLEGDTVLDPFGGAGTVGLVADRLGRHAVLAELNPEYAAIARQRIDNDAPMVSEPVTVASPQQATLFETAG